MAWTGGSGAPDGAAVTSTAGTHCSVVSASSKPVAVAPAALGAVVPAPPFFAALELFDFAHESCADFRFACDAPAVGSWQHPSPSCA